MSLLHGFGHRLRALLQPARHARELREEVEFHLALDAMHQGAGAPRHDDAHYAARRRFGNVTRYREDTRDMTALAFFDTARQDVRFALRTFRHAPVFTLVAVLTIALGIGATAAIFSVVRGIILEPLPYPDAERAVMVWMDNRRMGMSEDIHSYPNLVDLKERNRVLSHLAAYREAGVNLTGDGEPQRVIAGVLQAEVFALLGAKPLAGTLFTAENEATGADAVVVLSHSLWQNRFGADRAVVGKQIQLNGRARTVVGIMQPGFAFPSPRAEVWIPLVVSEGLRTARSAFAYPAIGRLAPGVSLARAQAEMSEIARRLETEYPSNREYGINLVPLPEQIVGPSLRRALWIMLAAVGAVLLIACANVANLLLSRAAVREREVTVRMALGASRRRLVRQLLTESVLLSLMGGALGVVLGVAGIRALRAIAPDELPRVEGVSLDVPVLLVMLVVTLVTGMIFGLVPALQGSRGALALSLREGGRSGTAGRGGLRLRRAIVAAQLAVVVVLLTGAGLLIRTFLSLQRTELGFRADGVLTATLQLPAAKYPEPPQAAAFYESLLQRLRATPGVTGAGTITTMFLSKTPSSGFIRSEGRPRADSDPEVTFDAVSPGAFEALGARLVAGRFFGPQDRDGSMPVAVVNETMARFYWGSENPIGRRYLLGDSDTDTTQSPWITVVGVVGDMRRTGLDMPVRVESFVPYAQSVRLGSMLLIRTSGDPMQVATRLRETVRAVDSDLPISSLRTMDELLGGMLAQRRFSMVLLASFAGLALALAIIGAYGVTSYLVTQRTREIGVRLALGAEPGRVARMVVADGMRVAVLGVGAGLILALVGGRLIAGLLYGVSTRDPITMIGVALLLLVTAMVANWLPARRAARVDPLVALRQE